MQDHKKNNKSSLKDTKTLGTADIIFVRLLLCLLPVVFMPMPPLNDLHGFKIPHVIILEFLPDLEDQFDYKYSHPLTSFHTHIHSLFSPFAHS